MLQDILTETAQLRAKLQEADALRDAAIRVAEAEHRSRFIGEGDDDLDAAMQDYARLREQK